MRDEIKEGQRAEQILESDLWKMADEEVKEWTLAKLIAHWQDDKALKEIAAFAVAHDKYKSFLDELVQNGKIRFHQIENSGE